MLSVLDAAAQRLYGGKATFGSADLIYGGNTTQWKKFAYSLMLRLGMRLTKVDITKAQTWVTKAIAGGVITADADIAKMPYNASGQKINQNPLALDLWNSDYIAQNGSTNTEGGKYQANWIDSLHAYKDPRLPVISGVCGGIKAGIRHWAIIGGSAGTIPAAQINTYVANHPLNTAGSFAQQMQQIYTQFWFGIFPDAQEVFATYRRTGYPTLVPNNYPGNATGGQIFRRMEYPISEQNLNAASYAAAITRQRTDNFMTHICWHKYKSHR